MTSIKKKELPRWTNIDVINYPEGQNIKVKELPI